MIEVYFRDRDQIEKPVFEDLLSEITRAVPNELLKFLPSLSFVMLKPDAYLRGLVPEIMAYLIQDSVYPVQVTVKHLRSEEVDRLYMFVKPRYLDSWWIMDKIYRLGPCCPAIVVGDARSFPHLSARIRDILGPTTPILGNESQIRYKFGGGHRIFNLIHGTDDPASAIREALVFFSMED